MNSGFTCSLDLEWKRNYFCHKFCSSYSEVATHSFSVLAAEKTLVLLYGLRTLLELRVCVFRQLVRSGSGDKHAQI